MASLLLIIHNREVIFMAKRKRIIDEKGVTHIQCNGPLCNGKMVPETECPNNYCRACNAEIQRIKVPKNFTKYKIKSIKDRFRRTKKDKYSYPDNIMELVMALKEKQDMKCYYSGIKLLEVKGNSNSFSIDRVDFSRNYSEGNIVLCTEKVNKIKGKIEFCLAELITAYGPQIGILTFNKIVNTLNEVHYLTKE